MDLLASNSQVLLEKSLGFLWTKQAAILDNIANAETPNYKAETAVNVFEHPEVTRTDDNGVSVTDQMVELSRNAYQTQYVMQCISGNLSLLRTAVRGQ